MTPKQTLLLLVAASLLSACASGIAPSVKSAFLHCPVDQSLLTLVDSAPPALPAAKAGDLDSLRDNRTDSKEAYETLHKTARALSDQVKPCLPPPQAPSALDERIQRLKARL